MKDEIGQIIKRKTKSDEIENVGWRRRTFETMDGQTTKCDWSLRDSKQCTFLLSIKLKENR